MNLKSRAISAPIAHSGEPTCPRSSETIDVTHSANCTSTGGKPKGISKVIEIWKMAGKAMLLTMAVLEMRAACCPVSTCLLMFLPSLMAACAAALAASFMSLSSSEVSASSTSDIVVVSKSWTADTFQIMKTTKTRITIAAIAFNSIPDPGQARQVLPCAQRESQRRDKRTQLRRLTTAK